MTQKSGTPLTDIWEIGSDDSITVNGKFIVGPGGRVQLSGDLAILEVYNGPFILAGGKLEAGESSSSSLKTVAVRGINTFSDKCELEVNSSTAPFSWRANPIMLKGIIEAKAL